MPTTIGLVMLKDAILALFASQQPSAQASFITSGLSFANVSGLIFRISAGTVSINGTVYSFSQTDVTLDAADGSNPRIDLIVADSGTGTIHKITGTAAANPVRPDYDPLTQFQITFILVPTGATSIPTVVQTALYHEATETTITTANGRIVGNSTNNPLAGTKDIEGTACIADDWVKLTNASLITVSAADKLVLNIRSKATWANPKNLQLTWFNSTTKVGQIVAISQGVFGFNSSNTTSYQQIVIPILAFALPANAQADALEIRVKGGGGSIGFYLDDIYLESSGVISGNTPTYAVGLAFTFGDGVTAPTAGALGIATVPAGFNACNLIGWNARLDVSGSAGFTIKKGSGDTGALASIGGTQPSVSSAIGAHGTPTTTTFSPGDQIAVTLDSITTAKFAELTLSFTHK